MHASSWKFVYVRNTARTAVFYKIRMKSKGTRMTQTAYGKLLDTVLSSCSRLNETHLW